MFADSSAGFFYLEMMRRKRMQEAQKHIFVPADKNIFTFKTAEEADIFRQKFIKKKGDILL